VIVIATLLSASFSRRSKMLLEVTLVLRFRREVKLLQPIVIDIVGGSTGIDFIALLFLKRILCQTRSGFEPGLCYYISCYGFFYWKAFYALNPNSLTSLPVSLTSRASLILLSAC